MPYLSSFVQPFIRIRLTNLFLNVYISQLPLTMDSASVSQELRQRLHQLGCIDIIIAGKGNDVLTIDTQKWDASTWKKVLMFEEPTWGIDVPSCRLWGSSPPFGSLMLFFVRKSTTRSYSLMHLSQRSLRGAEIWHIWKQHLYLFNKMGCNYDVSQEAPRLRTL